MLGFVDYEQFDGAVFGVSERWVLVEHADELGVVESDAEVAVGSFGLGEEVASHCDPSDSDAKFFLEPARGEHAHDGFAGTGGGFDHAAFDAGGEEGFIDLVDDSFLVGARFGGRTLDQAGQHVWFLDWGVLLSARL